MIFFYYLDSVFGEKGNAVIITQLTEGDERAGFEIIQKKAVCAVLVRAGENWSWPCARVGMTLPLAARMVGPAGEETNCLSAERYVGVTKEPVAPESWMAYWLCVAGGTKALEPVCE